MINKIKEILNILTNNIEKYGVSIYTGYRYMNNNDKVDYYQVTFRQFDKWYNFQFTEKEIRIGINLKDIGELGGTITMNISPNEFLPIRILLDTLKLKGEEFIKNSINNLELF